MKKISLIVLAGILCSGCSSTMKPRSHVPWYEDLNPATEDTISDWAIVDLDVSSYQRDPSFGETIWSDTVETFW